VQDVRCGSCEWIDDMFGLVCVCMFICVGVAAVVQDWCGHQRERHDGGSRDRCVERGDLLACERHGGSVRLLERDFRGHCARQHGRDDEHVVLAIEQRDGADVESDGEQREPHRRADLCDGSDLRDVGHREVER
jgi:hypothetical protein